MSKQATYIRKGNAQYIEYTGGEGIYFPTKPTVSGDGLKVPFTLLNLGILYQHRYKLDDKLLSKKALLQEKGIATVDIPDVLMPFQVESVRKLVSKSGALLADEQGLGKTLQIITTIDKRPELRPCVVICPAHLKYNWLSEFKKWTPHLNVEILNTQTSYELSTDIVIINYEIVQHWADYLASIGTKMVVCDEAHRVKNREAKATKAMLRIGQNPMRIMATGTPLVNDPENVWALVDSINPLILGGHAAFNGYFTTSTLVPIYYKGKPLRKFGKVMMRKQLTGTRNLPLLNTVLMSSVMIRRTKAEVLPQLPKKVRTILPVDVNLKQQNTDTLALLMSNTDALGKEKAYAKLYKELGDAKVPAAIQWLEDFLASSGEQIVVVGWHRDVLTRLHKHFKKDSVLIIGGITDKDAKIEQFKSGQKRVLFGNIKAAGTGLTLTTASTMLIAELPMTSAELGQVMDRIHRIGQTEQCNYYFLIGKDTLEEKIVGILDKKLDMANQVVDGKIDMEVMLGGILQEAINAE